MNGSAHAKIYIEVIMRKTPINEGFANAHKLYYRSNAQAF